MKTRTKITVTLAVGIGLLAGSMGVASASPHYSDWSGKTSFKAPVSSYSHNLEWDLKASEIGVPPEPKFNPEDTDEKEDKSGLHDSVHCLRSIKGKFRECSAL